MENNSNNKNCTTITAILKTTMAIATITTTKLITK